MTRTVRFVVLLTEAERAKLQAVAEHDGVTPSAWLRMQVRLAKCKSKKASER